MEAFSYMLRNSIHSTIIDFHYIAILANDVYFTSVYSYEKPGRLASILGLLENHRETENANCRQTFEQKTDSAIMAGSNIRHVVIPPGDIS